MDFRKLYMLDEQISWLLSIQTDVVILLRCQSVVMLFTMILMCGETFDVWA